MKKLLLSFVVMGAVAFAGVANSVFALTVQEVLDLRAAGFSTSEIVTMFGTDGSTGGATTGTTTYGYTYTQFLKPGMSGAAVQALQLALNTYAGASLVVDGNYGPNTAAAVRAFQASKGLSVDGLVGPNTGAALQAAAAITVTVPVDDDEEPAGDDDDTDLEGGAGSLDYDQVSSLNNEEVGENQDDEEVLGVDIEAEGSDVEILAVRVDFDQSTGATNDDFSDYASEVSVWLDGKEVGRIDADEFTERNGWVDTITLDGAIIREGDEERLVIAVSGARNIDTNDKGDTWQVDITSIRYEDSTGAILSETPTVTQRSFTFEGYATAADVELKIALEDESINDAHILDVHASNNTDKVAVLSFTMEARGNSDITIDDLPFELTTGGMNIDDAIPTVYLYADGDLIASENTTATDTDETITFNNIDYTIEAGDEVEFIIKVDINDLDAGTGVDNGDTVQAQITSVERALIDADDESGEQLATADMTGTAVGETHAIYDAGIMVDLVSVTQSDVQLAEVENTGDNVTWTFTFDVTAFDGDMYVDGTVTEDGDGTYADGSGVNYYITRADTGADAAALTTPAAALTSTTATASDNTTWKVDEGTTDRFTLTVNVANTVTDDGADDALLFKTAITSIGWDTSAIAATTNSYTFNLDEFVSGAVRLGELDAAA